MLQAALNEKVKDKLVPDTETTITIEVGPAALRGDRSRPHCSPSRARTSMPNSAARSTSTR